VRDGSIGYCFFFFARETGKKIWTFVASLPSFIGGLL
jgi:hypothetical protein